MAAARAGTVLAFNVAAAPLEGLQVRKKLERALRDWFQGEPVKHCTKTNTLRRN